VILPREVQDLVKKIEATAETSNDSTIEPAQHSQLLAYCQTFEK
jgi:hypothetical protein